MVSKVINVTALLAPGWLNTISDSKHWPSYCTCNFFLYIQTLSKTVIKLLDDVCFASSVVELICVLLLTRDTLFLSLLCPHSYFLSGFWLHWQTSEYRSSSDSLSSNWLLQQTMWKVEEQESYNLVWGERSEYIISKSLFYHSIKQPHILICLIRWYMIMMTLTNRSLSFTGSWTSTLDHSSTPPSIKQMCFYNWGWVQRVKDNTHLDRLVLNQTQRTVLTLLLPVVHSPVECPSFLH